MNTNDEMVTCFQQQVLRQRRPSLGLPPEKDFKLYLNLMREELQELEDAYNAQDLVAYADALIDTDYAHKGLVFRSGIRVKKYNLMFKAVHHANMQKNAGITDRSPPPVNDAIKPKGWIGPEDKLHMILFNEVP